MHIKLKNHHLIPLVPFLKDMKLKGEKSRARSKFLNIAMEAYAALHESEVDLLKDYAVLGEDGEPLTDAEGGFTLREDAAKEYLAEREKLFFEEAEIEGGTYSEHLSMMRQILSDYDEDLDGENAALYDALCDAFDAETVEESETNA